MMVPKFIVALGMIAIVGCASIQPTKITTVASDSTAPATTESPSLNDTATSKAVISGTLIAGNQTAVATLHTHVPQPSFTPFTPFPTLTPNGSLSADGPWLLFTARQGCGGDYCPNYLWAMNSDGTGLQHIIDDHIVNFAVRPGATKTHAEIAFVSGEEDPLGGPKILKMLVLPERTVTQILTIAQTELLANGNETTPIAPEAANRAMRAYFDSGELAWSPKGTLLAFTGSIPGPTSDLFTYDPESREVNRISDNGAYHAVLPEWSPNGRWLMHQGRDETAYAGPPASNAIWGSSADGKIIRPLFDPMPNGKACCDYQIFDWPADSSVYVGVFRYHGPSEVRAVNIETGDMAVVRSDKELTEAAYDPKHNEWLFWFNAEDQNVKDRLIFVGPDGEHEVPLVTDSIYGISWSPELEMFLISISWKQEMGWTEKDGFIDLHAPAVKATSPSISPDGEWWAWFYGWGQDPDGGIWIGKPFDEPHQITDVWISNTIWSDDGSKIFMWSEYGETGGLLLAYAPDFEPYLITDSLNKLENPTWIP